MRTVRRHLRMTSYEGSSRVWRLELGVEMKRKHLFVFYCSLLVPITVLAGVGAGRATDLPLLGVLLGVAVGIEASYLLLRLTSPGDTP